MLERGVASHRRQPRDVFFSSKKTPFNPFFYFYSSMMSTDGLGTDMDGQDGIVHYKAVGEPGTVPLAHLASIYLLLTTQTYVFILRFSSMQHFREN